MDSKTTEISWDFIPPEKHFQSPKELKETINLYLSFGFKLWEMYPGIKPPEDKFEIVRHSTEDGEKYYLWPTSLTHSYLFRGQEHFFERCVPSLFRKESITPTELFINQVQLEEFRLMLQQYPQVRYFEKSGIVVDYKGLAQHYGIKTDVLDLTSSLDVALFFAMCSYDSTTHGYTPKTDSSHKYIGYLYAYPYILHMAFGKTLQGSLNLMPIGLQPFKRPGLQRGFALHFRSEEQFEAPIYSFSYTAKDSMDIYSKLSHIFEEDDLAKTTRAISESNELSIEALVITCARHSSRILGRKLSYGKGRELLISNGIKLTANPSWYISSEKREQIYNTFMKKELTELHKSLVQRQITIDDKNYPYIDFRSICNYETINLFKKGCPSLKGYDSGIAIAKSVDSQIVGLSFNCKRPQTIPNKDTGIVDHWNNLPWDQYQLPKNENRFAGEFPKISLVKEPRDRSLD